MRSTPRRTGIERRLERVVQRSRAAMAAESFASAFWPLAAAAIALWACLAFGIADLAGRGELIAGLGLAGAGLALLLWQGLRRFRWPSRAAAVARVDAALPGRPLATLADRLALGADDPAARGLWEAHLARMRARAAAAEPVRPDLRLAERDPWALRLAALVLFLAALVFARGDPVSSVASALAPGPAEVAAQGPSFEGWAEPPAYTGRPTLYLPEISGGGPVQVPQGTKVTLRVYGEAERFALEESVSGAGPGAGFDPAAEGIGLAEFDVARSGRVGVARGGDEIGAWSFELQPDAPPEIAMSAPLERSPAGETRLAYTASDDYGVTVARAEIVLDLPAVDRRHGRRVEPEAREPLVVDLPLPMTGRAPEVAETLVDDFSTHPWVGLPVRVTLVAEDALGQEGRESDIEAVLPGRRFFDPVAAALAEQRRDLLWSAENGRRVRQLLRAVTHRPGDHFDRAGAFLIVRTAIRRLDAALDAGSVPEVRDEVAEALWRAALILEEGSLGDAAERLARARERLAEALRNDATDEEIAELMDELREATRDYMEQMAREALESGEAEMAEAPPPGQGMSQDQIQQLMDRIQELSEQGRRAEAEALLEMLQQLLDNMEMRFTQGQPGEGGEGQQSMQGLADALREQQGLADENFQQLQREFRDGRQGDGQQGDGQQGDGQQGDGQQGQQFGGDPLGGGQPGEQPGGEPQQGPGSPGQSLAQRQEALRELMDELRQNLPGSAAEGTRDSLGEAERNMGEARDGLENGDTAGALDRQSAAIENLREGMRGLAEDMRQAQGSQGDQSRGSGAPQAQNGTDPLGRRAGPSGGPGTDAQMLPEADAAARARSILDEIRRRSGDLARPQIELDYLRRLLDRF
jgi:uncharacterized protein (TIGR02302 family)